MKRSVSFLVIALIYVAASVLGIVLCGALPYALWLNILIADIAATVFTFVFSLIFKNASVYDPYWSVQPIVILGAVCAAHGSVGLPQLLILIAVFFWGLRLTANWAYTFGGMAHQDWRYTMLKEKTGVFYPVINFVGIHMVPTLVVYLCTMPAVQVLVNDVRMNVGCALFVLVSVGAAVLQGAADIQMHRFRRNRTGSFIRTGLWKYSRHPNYLGEILMWWGIGLAAFSLMHEWYLLVGAAANTLLFLCVSIPLADNRQAKKEGFAEYRSATRMLLPIKK